jgi:tetratricopeptide (TPR) repeat protein
MGAEAGAAFVDLRRLADWFASLKSGPSAVSIERVVRRLGPVCIPLLGREMTSPDPRRREAARVALAHVAQDIKPRVVSELRRIAASAAPDDIKVCALGLLAELGERSTAKFTDAPALQRRSAIALASELDNPADVAAAVDMMIHQMADDEMVTLLDVMAEASAGAAHHLAIELCARLDVAADIRERITQVALGKTAPLPVHERRVSRPPQVCVLADATGRVVVVASRKILGERRWRRWAVLVDAKGGIDDCIHEDRSSVDADHGPLVANLVADGYRVASNDLERARGLVAAAARHSAAASDAPDRLPAAYYLGRDLLDLGEAHLGGRVHAHPTSTTLGRAVELIADSDLSRAQLLLARCDDQSPDVAAATAACLMEQNKFADALPALARAIELEPDFALHYWNHAAALHKLGDANACHAALRRFLAASERPTGLFADPDHPARVSLATRLIAELERTARLAGTPLGTRPRRKRKRLAKR